MTRSFPTHLNEWMLVGLVETAETRVIMALPSLTECLGTALIQANDRLPSRVLAVIDTDERVYRLGYGSIKEVEAAFGKGMPLLTHRGLRMGCCLVDEIAFFLTLPPQLVEAGSDPETIPINAVAVDPQVAIAYLRGIANGPELDQVLCPHPELSSQAQEDPLVRIEESAKAKAEKPLAEPVHPKELEVVQASLALAPPLDFQVHRQSMVYTTLLLYVVVELTACRLDNREISVNKILLPLLGEKADIVGRRSFQLKVEGDLGGLAEIRNRVDNLRTEMARPLGKPYGTVLLRRDLEKFEKEVEAIRVLIGTKHPEAIARFEAGLATQIDDIRHICLEQCLHTMNDQEIISALRPKARDHRELTRWERWKNSQPSRSDMADRLETKINDALWANVRQMLVQLTRPKLEITIREFTLQQMDEQDFLDCLLGAFHDVPDLSPYLDSKAVIGRETGKE